MLESNTEIWFRTYQCLRVMANLPKPNWIRIRHELEMLGEQIQNEREEKIN